MLETLHMEAKGKNPAKKVIVMIRAGLVYEKGTFSAIETQSALSGPSAGISIDMPFGKNESTLGVDYSFRNAPVLGAIHGIGIRLNLGEDEE